MRATWITSIAAGFAMGVAARVTETAKLSGALPLTVFVVVGLIGVIGILQLREAYGDRTTKGSSVQTGKGVVYTTYLPTWGRMFLFFLACVITVGAMRVVGW